MNLAKAQGSPATHILNNSNLKQVLLGRSDLETMSASRQRIYLNDTQSEPDLYIFPFYCFARKPIAKGEKYMLPAETLSLFLTSSILLALAPGPDNLFVLAQSAQHGRKAGLIVTFGLCTGVMVHTAAVSFGVAAIFQTSVLAFTVLKYIGAAYLIFLAWMSFKASGKTRAGEEVKKLSIRKLYFRGVIMNVTNPKVSIFFLAFLPQFVDPSHGPIIPQMLQLGALFILSTIWIFGGVALLAGTFGAWLSRSDKATKILNWMAGSVFAGLAIKLVMVKK